MNIRKLHRTCAIIFSPLFLILAITGCALLFRKTQLYSKDTKSFLVSIHTWEIIAPYIGLIFGIGFIVIIVTGILIYFKKD
ncbi:MAG TPA: hypothetical protein QF753_06625 [Victivallales bacterium]|nr:hypothetical protein [Victivallales bacterium]